MPLMCGLADPEKRGHKESMLLTCGIPTSGSEEAKSHEES